MVKCNCKNCNDTFYTTPSRIQDGKGKFCSKKCYTDHQNKLGTSKIINAYCKKCGKGLHLTNYHRRVNIQCCSIKCSTELRKKRINKICPICNSTFETEIRLNKKYCSKNCKKIFYENSKLIFICKYCNNEFKFKKEKRKIKENKNYFCSNKCKFKWGVGKSHPSMSKWLADNISSGNFNPMSQNYHQGYIMNNSTGFLEYYHSSYEKLRMEQLNKLKVYWTKKHNIKIKYIDNNKIERYYIPDILIDNKILEEIKPKRLLTHNNNDLKFMAAKKYCDVNNIKFKVLTEDELFSKQDLIDKLYE